MKNVFIVSAPDPAGGTDFYVVAAEDHDEAAGIISEMLDVYEDTLQVEFADIVLNNQYGGVAALTTV